MIPHLHPWRFQNEKKNLGAQTRLTTKEKLMTTKHERAPWDGVKNVKYRLESVEHNKIFTKINVDFRRFIVNSLYVVVDGQTEMNIILPQARKCKYEEFEDAYLDSTHIQILNKDQEMVNRILLFEVIYNVKSYGSIRSEGIQPTRRNSLRFYES